MATTCRLIIDPPGEGPWNMAVDEVLLESAAENGIATLRFYRWKVPTLSLGYFQAASDRTHHPPSLTCPMVRRSSGGGAILHDRELTYSLALPASHPLAKDADGLYCSVHTALIESLNECLGAYSELSAHACVPHAVPPEEAFLCFLRRAAGDVLLAGKAVPGDAQKVAGSAQRRRRGAVLQHGSLLRSESPFAPELPGIEQLSGVRLDEEAIKQAWIARLRASLNVQISPQVLVTKETMQARELAAERFASSDWTNRR